MKEKYANEIVGLLNKRGSLKRDLLLIERVEYHEGVDILFWSLPLELSEDEFNFVKDVYITKISRQIKEIDAELSSYGINMEND